MENDFEPDSLPQLVPELREVVDAELAAGNRVWQTTSGYGKPGSVFVMLGEPFRTTPAALPPGVVFREINDPHWWKAEYYHDASGDTVACPFPSHRIAGGVAGGLYSTIAWAVWDRLREWLGRFRK